MSTTAPALIDAATAVAALGTTQADIDVLDDVSLQEGMRLLAALDQQTQPYRLWMAAAIAKRSDHTLGYDGLARKNGFPTPAVFIQSLTGSSLDEATKLARLGGMIADAESEPAPAADGTGGSGSGAIAIAATSGGISVDAADAIRRGLGRPDAAVSAEQLRGEAERLIAHAQQAASTGVVTPEALLKLARQAREALDVEAVARGEKERSDQRYTRIWERDGMYGGSWKLTAEDGGAEINTALKLVLAKHTGGPRFPETDATGEPIAKTDAEVAIEKVASEDTRSMDQLLADGFTQIMLGGLRVDPSVVPGAGRAPVRVIVTEKVLAAGYEAGQMGKKTGTALLEDNLSAITFGKLEEYLCEGGTIGVLFNDDGSMNVGREQRLFTSRQRTALGVRDGGCRFPGCDKPPSWCEAHHIEYWARDQGRTDVQLGILLCRYHHMFIHNRGWEIIRGPGDAGGSTFYLKPPPEVDPDQMLIEMPTKNPLVAALKHAQNAAPASV